MVGVSIEEIFFAVSDLGATPECNYSVRQPSKCAKSWRKKMDLNSFDWFHSFGTDCFGRKIVFVNRMDSFVLNVLSELEETKDALVHFSASKAKPKIGATDSEQSNSVLT
jgi:hypothetical protein